MKKFLLILMISTFMIGCSSKNDDNTIINYLDAKEKIINEGAVLVDVRTQDEYNQKHIDGAELLPLDMIDENSILDIVDSKDDVIILYCQSGNRSGQALTKLKSLGYKKVYDLGAMSNWEE